MADATRRAAAKQDTDSATDDGKRSPKKRTPSKPKATKRATTKQAATKKTTKSSTTRTNRTTQQNNAGQRSATGRRAQTAPHLAEVQPSSAPRKVTMGSRSRAISLRTDLQKYGQEKYKPEEFLAGTQLIMEAGAGERLRDLVASVLRSKGAFGNMQSEHVMEALLDQLTDGYRKRKVAERKSIRAMLNWCSGLAQTDPEVESELLQVVMSQGS